jgi:hypothetical protein
VLSPLMNPTVCDTPYFGGMLRLESAPIC